VLKGTNGKFIKTHGCSHTRVHRSWRSMILRCTDPRCASYPRYGGAGVTVYKPWFKFEVFLQDMGHPPTEKHTIDRIDSSKGYEPSNCRWVTPVEQNRNRSIARYVQYNGESRCLAEWASCLRMSKKTLDKRINVLGWSIEKALSTPVRKCRRKRGT